MSDSDSSVADRGGRPTGRAMYYGGGNRAIYYGGSARPMYYGGGGTPYGGSAYGGAAYGGATGGAEDDSMLGAVTIGRMLRIMRQRWVTIAVFVIVGAIAAFAVYKVSPQIYEAESVFEMSIRRPSYLANPMVRTVDADFGSNMDEVFNTRLARLRSRAVVEAVLNQYRADFPSSMATDEDIVKVLVGTKMTLQRRSRLIRLSARSTDAQLATELVNAYSKTAETFTTDLNKSESEAAVSWLVSTTEQQKRELERMDREMLEFRTANQLDLMASEAEATKQALGSVNSDILVLEAGITKATELRKTLDSIQNDPEKFGSLPDSIPRSSDINVAFGNLQKIKAEKNALLARFTANHPDVKVMEKQVEVYERQFADEVNRAFETCKANLDLLQRQYEQLAPRRDDLMRKLSDIELKIVPARMKLEQFERAREVGDINYKSLLQRTREAQLASDENTAIIRQVEAAAKPQKPVLPNPFIIFPSGPILGLMLGVLFVLALDHLEDKIVGLSDIENRLRLKPLAVLPHVRRKNREQLARLVKEDKFSQFAEGIAGLRNLLDSPRYVEMSKVVLVMSTLPGEGKTVTSCGLAQSSAQSGQRTLLIDFDMRRPRLARIFDKTSHDFKSLPHVLAEGDPTQFPSLPVASGVENLDLVLSKASSAISPANLMGSGTIVEFFTWARENYDRVVVDSPPFGIVGDVVALASLVDSVMIMCCPDRTRFRPVKHAARHLTESGARVIGVVVNDVDFGRGSVFGQYDYHYRYAYHYASRYGSYGQGARKQADEEGLADVAATVPGDDEVVIGDDHHPAARHGTTSRQDMVDYSMTDDE